MRPSVLPASVSTGGFFTSYEPLGHIYDESVGRNGLLRPHWKSFAGTFEKLGFEELSARRENARNLISENGITYNVYGDPLGMDRPWELDLIPLLIAPEEWRGIEAGLKQRAHLLNLVLADLYGPQKLLRTGLLPPALVHANPGFLRPCHGVRVPRDIHLHLHAADLARSPDGQWWVLADRTQAPSGSGYALENRIVISRTLPEEFRALQVHRLASFFSVQQEALRAIAPRGTENPHVVLLTPGPYNETYFEHAYLARYLGFTLAEGGDLTVRNQRVYVKTLEGLQPVDVVFRRVDDIYCDPLELRGESFLGVAGLVEAARAGNVAIANALGSSLMESPAFLAFLPGLCRHLLGEELKLPSVATWWCGQAEEQRYVLEHLDQLVVKPAFGHVAQLPFFGRDLPAQERGRLAASIAARPFEYVGQEQVAFSTAPVWMQNKLEPRGVVLRAFISAGIDGYSVMPGGLTRVSTAAGNPVVTMQSGGGSKDTWVLSEGPVAAVSLLGSSGQPVAAVRCSTELTSRVADNLFWLGRYAERLEGMLRLLRSVIARMSEETGANAAAELSRLVQSLVELKLIPAQFGGRIPLKQLEQEILQLLYTPARSGSVRDLVLRIRQLGAAVRDRFSSDTSRILNEIQLHSRSRAGRLPMAGATALINTLIADLAAFSGMEMENMTRGHGWRFLDFGRRLERAVSLVELLDACLGADRDAVHVLSPLLEIADSSMTYRRRYFSHPQLGAVLELLLADESNPRSFAFQLLALRDHAAHLPAETEPCAITSKQDRVRTIDAGPTPGEVRHLAELFISRQPESLRQWLRSASAELGAVSDELTEKYFSLTIQQRS